VRSAIWRVLRSPWLSAAALVAVVEFVVVLGQDATVRENHLQPPLDATARVLLVVAGGATVLRRWPLVAWGVALAATVAYLLLGYPGQGPLGLGVMVALYFTVAADRPWRSVVVGAVTAGSLLAANAVQAGTGSIAGSLIGDVLLAAVPLSIGHIVAGRRAWTRRTQEEEAQRRVTEERLRIARELHDVVSHTISTINVQAGVAAHVLDDRPEQAREALLAIKATSKEALRELRAILGVLRDVDDAEPRAPAPGLADLDALVHTAVRAGVPTRVTVSGEPRALPPGVDLVAYRIVQEALTNVVRHAGQANVEVQVRYEDGHVAVQVTDDGPGPEAPPPDGRGSGHGIEGMRERAAAVGGVLEAGPRPVRGFRVHASLPVS
jgi:signal transduction histidine kinase